MGILDYHISPPKMYWYILGRRELGKMYCYIFPPKMYWYILGRLNGALALLSHF